MIIFISGCSYKENRCSYKYYHSINSNIMCECNEYNKDDGICLEDEF